MLSVMAKKEVVEGIFNDIAPKYDLLNHLLSLNIDKGWRRKAMRCVEEDGKGHLLDVACGTGDFSIAACRAGVRQVTGIDISANMVNIGRKKVAEAGLAGQIDLRSGDSEAMEFSDNTFDTVTVAFGVRNFEHLEQGLREMYRVLRPGGKVIILEFSMPEHFPMKQLFWIYSHTLLPLYGKLISKDKNAYKYLINTIESFPQGEEMVGIFKKAGFSEARFRRLTFGICTCYLAIK